MRRRPLKELRLAAGKTQAEVAQVLRVTQPTYQRWESGGTPVPKDKIKRLAKVLSTTEDIIQGKPKPFDLLGIAKDVPDDRTYFGEVAFHFMGPGAPILVPISKGARADLLRDVERDTPFLFVESLDNRTLFVRSAAIADIYVSSEAYDTFGPQPEAYDDHLGVLPDDAYWRIIEHFECPECLADDYSQDEIQNVVGRIAWSDVIADQMIARGELSASDREEAISDADQLLTRATCVTWQLASGARRNERADEDTAIYNAFVDLRDHADYVNGVIYFPAEGHHRSIMIKPSAVDYIWVPTHRFKNGELAALEEELG
jgi:DNA-binding XRE family transcriptional regulator